MRNSASRAKTPWTTRSQRTPMNGNAFFVFVPTRAKSQPRAIARPRCKRTFTLCSVRSSASAVSEVLNSSKYGTVPEGQAVLLPGAARARLGRQFVLDWAKSRNSDGFRSPQPKFPFVSVSSLYRATSRIDNLERPSFSRRDRQDEPRRPGA
jgi:hypothetical protein